MKHVEHLLQEKIGLDAASVGSTSIERTLRLRMKSLGVKRPEDYLEVLETNPGEWEELVESVIVTETWFFRDRDPFTVFVQLALEHLARTTARRLRVLSIPCSSGEEPYSLAMALLDANLSAERFKIDGVDISARAIARARKGFYGKNSFRGKHLDFQERHFHATKEGYLLDARVRDCVEFQHANLLDDNFLAGYDPYDFIFCRNLLIYFDRETQAAALGKLNRFLSPQGTLFVGPAELPLATKHGFVSANVPMAFACRKGNARVAPLVSKRQRLARAIRPVETAPPPRHLPPPTMPVSHAATPVAPVRQAEPPALADLAAARQMADSGKLEEAAAICELHIRHQGPTAQAFYLLGLVRDACGDPQALDYYRKALYLEPDHYETLLQMALLMEKIGDSASAKQFKRRAQRIEQKA